MSISSGIGSLGFKPGVCTSSSRPASPFEGQMIYETDTDSVAFWDGSYWRYIEARQNILYNGAMQVHQRGTSTASITGSGYYTADRWYLLISALGTWTQAVVSTTDDFPSGSGFRKSLKMTCTTADSSPASGDYCIIEQRLEGQDLQTIRKGTTSAQQVTLSFWVRSGVTGTFICQLDDSDNTRSVSRSYTINAANTWEFKTLTFPADSTGSFNNDNQLSLAVRWWLGAGSTFTSGTLNTAWQSTTSGNLAVGQSNVASGNNSAVNYWQITGVQFNTGAISAPFEFKTYSTELRDCQRYYQRFTSNTAYGQFSWGVGATTTAATTMIPYLVPLRAAPVTANFEYSNVAPGDGVNAPLAPSAASLDHSSTTVALVNFTVTGATQYRPYFLMANNNTAGYVGFNVEL